MNASTGAADLDESGSPDWHRWPPHVLREYAVLADGCRAALVGPRGDVAFLCAPRWDSEAVFSALVGGHGVYALAPTDPQVWGGYYEAATLIWRSRWTTPSTVIECREALAVPGDEHTVVLLRRVDAIERDASVHVTLAPAAAFGREPMRDLRRDEHGVWTARAGDLHVRWSGAPRAQVVDDRLEADVTVPGGDHHDLVLEVSDRPLGERVDPMRAWRTTEQWWAERIPRLESCAAPRDARHAYAVMLGLTSPGGGMVAAATLGLPERAEAGRNYDYRYVWLRDQAYAGMACAVDEPLPLLDVAVHQTTETVLAHGDDLAPAYRVDGTPLPGEHSLHLSGYPGGSDVVGNWVNQQFQLDAVGEILQLLAAAARHDRLDGDGRRAVRVAAELVEKRWQQPDAGVWELDDAWWTQSRLACVAGLRKVATHVQDADGDRWDALADTILEETSRRCLDRDGSWRRSPDHDGTDASLLLPPVRGALAADDPRTRATLDRVRRELTEDGYVYRFRPDDEPLGQNEGAFLMCGFTMSLACAHAGDHVEAGRWFERTRAACGPPGLLTEEFDVRQRQLRGNLPQAFAHAMLLETAQGLGRPLPSAQQPDRKDPA